MVNRRSLPPVRPCREGHTLPHTGPNTRGADWLTIPINQHQMETNMVLKPGLLLVVLWNVLRSVFNKRTFYLADLSFKDKRLISGSNKMY